MEKLDVEEFRAKTLLKSVATSKLRGAMPYHVRTVWINLRCRPQAIALSVRGRRLMSPV